MVRRKTQSGAIAQPSQPVAGQTYGNGAEQQQLQQAMPAPNGRVATPAAAPVATPPAAPAQPGTPDIGALLQLAQGQGAGAGLLTGGTGRPDEPVTAGLPIGPGPGPEAIGFAVGSTPGQRFLRSLGQQLNDAYFSGLADRIAQ